MSVSVLLSQKIAAFEAAADRAPKEVWIDRSHAVSSEARAGASRRPLEGMLFAVKDNIDVEGFDTTLACPSFAYRPARSARVVELLMQAGATMVGKTNLDQFACGLVGTRSPYGAVPNAFNPDYVSGGSSSGSAVAVASGLVDFALGTDTAGSGRIPPGFNNLVGIKPSRGLISGRGVYPACQHIDCVSVMARTVDLAAEVLRQAIGFDAEDPFSRTRALLPGFFGERFRVGIPDVAHLQFFGDKIAREAFTEALELVAGIGGSIERVPFAPFARIATALYEDAWVAERYAAIRPFYDQFPETLDPVVRSIIERGKHHLASQVFAAMADLGHAQQQSRAIWTEIDVMVVPTAPTHPTRAAVAAEPLLRNVELGYYTNFVNLMDLAAVSVPAVMRSDGLPFGITLIGPPCSEWQLLALASRMHQASGLKEGALGTALPSERTIAPTFHEPMVRVAVVGAHLDGLPLNYQLRDRHARLIEKTATAACYRLYALPSTTPPKPGLVRVDADRGDGCAIELELWDMPLEHYGSFVAGIPAPLGIGSVELLDGSRVQGFLCEAHAIAGAEDISRFGGWRAYLARPEQGASQPSLAANQFHKESSS